MADQTTEHIPDIEKRETGRQHEAGTLTSRGVRSAGMVPETLWFGVCSCGWATGRGHLHRYNARRAAQIHAEETDRV